MNISGQRGGEEGPLSTPLAKTPETAQIEKKTSLKMHLRGLFFRIFLTLRAWLRGTHQKLKSRSPPSSVRPWTQKVSLVVYLFMKELNNIIATFL